MSSRSPATLLVGFDPRTALAIARPLWRAKVRVVVATIADWETPLGSRAVDAYVKLPGPENSEKAFREELDTVIAAQEIDTIIPVTDRALSILSPHFEYLSSRVRLASPTPAQTGVILDKAETAVLATKLGVPVPRSFETHSLCKRIDQLPYPLFAKARDKRIYFEGDNSIRPGAHFVKDAPALRSLLAESPNACLLVEEYVEGDDVGLAVLMNGGDAMIAFQYRAELLYPAKGGISVVARTEAVDPALLQSALTLLRALQWQGIAQLDFRHNRETGKFAFLEINGRFWGSTAVSTLAGLNLPYSAWQLAHGQKPSVPSSYRIGMRARWFEGDVRRLVLILADTPRPSFLVRAREFLKLVARFRFGVSGMFWSWADPSPAISTCFHFAKNWLIGKFRGPRSSAILKEPTLPPAETIGSLDPVNVTRVQRGNLGE